MWAAWWFVARAAPTLDGLDVSPSGFRASYDLTVAIGPDGALSVDGRPAVDLGVADLVRKRAAELGPDARVVVAADVRVPYARVLEVLDLVQAVGLARVALEVGTALPPADPLSPLGHDVVNLDEQEFGDTFQAYRPKRHQYPQNPYQSTDFTAYTREPGEVRLGLAALSVGVLPRVHLGTSPMLDVVGIYNGSAKWNFARAKRLDFALAGGVYVVPVTRLLATLDDDGSGTVSGVSQEDVFVDTVTTTSLSLTTSLQVVGGWSIHAGTAWTRARAVGNLDFNNLPQVVVPGLEPIGGDLTLVPRVRGELLDVRFATDLRFNRRDSLILQASATAWAHAQADISADLSGLPDALGGVDFAIGYGQAVSPADTYRASLAWQFSWRKVDLRFGLGAASPTISAGILQPWLVQAFDLAYRFGGATRRTEHKVKKAYREDRKEIETIEEIEFAPPPPEPEGG